MPTRHELAQEVAEIRERVGREALHARRLRKMGLINGQAENEMIVAASLPQGLDPEQFPNAGRLK